MYYVKTLFNYCNLLVCCSFFCRPDNEKYYNFTLLASQLNELEEGVAPTDSRLRSDQRLMEFGLWDEANIEKLRLEEIQRVRNRKANFGVADCNQINENGTKFNCIILYLYK